MLKNVEGQTPVARMKYFEEISTKIENKGWKGEQMELYPEISYFNNKLQHSHLLEYDLFFAYTKPCPLWDPKKIKDNIGYLPKIRENIFKQEKHKSVPALTSFNYGKTTLIPYDVVEIAFQRSRATADFYRRRGGMFDNVEE